MFWVLKDSLEPAEETMNLYEKAHEIADSSPIPEEQKVELTRMIADLAITESMKQSTRQGVF